MNNNTPKAHQSTAIPCPLVCNISGARYIGVPENECTFGIVFDISLDKPKSTNRKYPI